MLTRPTTLPLRDGVVLLELPCLAFRARVTQDASPAIFRGVSSLDAHICDCARDMGRLLTWDSQPTCAPPNGPIVACCSDIHPGACTSALPTDRVGRCGIHGSREAPPMASVVIGPAHGSSISNCQLTCKQHAKDAQVDVSSRLRRAQPAPCVFAIVLEQTTTFHNEAIPSARARAMSHRGSY